MPNESWPYCVVHLLSEGVPSLEDASTSWPSSSGIRGHRTQWFDSDVGKIILKVISDQIKIIFSKNDFKSDQDHIF
jgi:hypothetical protein